LFVLKMGRKKGVGVSVYLFIYLFHFYGEGWMGAMGDAWAGRLLSRAEELVSINLSIHLPTYISKQSNKTQNRLAFHCTAETLVLHSTITPFWMVEAAVTPVRVLPAPQGRTMMPGLGWIRGGVCID
jgi:hypothetical protein